MCNTLAYCPQATGRVSSHDDVDAHPTRRLVVARTWMDGKPHVPVLPDITSPTDPVMTRAGKAAATEHSTTFHEVPRPFMTGTGGCVSVSAGNVVDPMFAFSAVTVDLTTPRERD